jgi:beta-glucosidase
MMPFMFATGIENSDPTIDHGRTRRDMLVECGHDERWREDFALVAELGIRHLRYGIPLHRSWVGPGRYDWSFGDTVFPELRRLGIEPIADLCHFGVPDWVGNFQNPEFPALFREYAAAFAKRYPWIRLYTPVNEMYVCAKFSGLYGWWNEQESSTLTYVTALKHLAKANVLAMQEILKHRPDAIFIQSESTEYFHACVPDAVEIADERNDLRFLSLDFNYGRPLVPRQRDFVLANGMTAEECRFFEENAIHNRHCVLGSDYYTTNEHLVQPDGSSGDAGEILGYTPIGREYAERYRLPLMHTETNLDEGPTGKEAVDWLQCQWAMVRSLMRVGVEVVGFTWYSLNDQIDWDMQLREKHGTVNPRGLVDLDRRVRPVGHAYRELIKAWTGRIDAGGASLVRRADE